MGRSIQIEEEELVKSLRVNCKGFLNKRHPFFRGYSKLDTPFPYYYIEPSKYSRRATTAKGSGNIHNLLIDNLDSWNGYPKRERSIIFSTSRNSANVFGNNIFIVAPFDNAELVIGPVYDNSYSFEKTFAKYNTNLRQLVDLNNALNSLSERFLNKKLIDEDWSKAKNILLELENKINASSQDIINQQDNSFLRLIYNRKSLIGLLNELMEPYKNGFILDNYENYSHLEDRELWTTSPCFLIREDCLEKLLQRVGY